MEIKEIFIQTSKKQELIDITSLIQEELEKLKNTSKKNVTSNGFVNVFVAHTTAGITINENADPDVKEDIINALKIFDKCQFKHLEGNSPAHVKASLIGSSVLIPIENFKLKLGQWQGVMFAEFDGPRKRKIILNFYF